MKRTLTSTISLLLCLLMLLSVVFTGCDEEENTDTPSDQTGTVPDANPDTSDTTIPCNGVSISSTSISLTVGESMMLTANVTPENATDKNVTWTSSNDAVAFVINGSVTAIGEGVAVIIATTSNGKTATCTVTVNSSVTAPTGVSLNNASLEMTVGYTAALNATVMPENANDKSLTWTSSNDAVATVDNGVVTAVKAGSATITVTTTNGKSATCTVTVTNNFVAVNGVSLNKSSVTLAEDESTTLTATVSPANASDRNVTWTSSNTSVASVSNGKVTAVGAGSATITVTTSNGKTATCNVTVTAVIRATSVSLNKTSLSLMEGESATLSATVSPSNATNKSVTWKSSNTKVATVSKGKVTAVGAGSATITVTTSNGKTATCTVTVTAVIRATSVSLNKTRLEFLIGDSYTLTATVSPADTTDKSVSWKSSNTKVATVSNGKVTALGAGSATITVTTSNGKTATCTVTVTGNPLDDFYYNANTTGYTITGVKNKNKTSYVVPNNVTIINDGVFAGCNNMESITLPGDISSKFGAIFGTLYDPKATATTQDGKTYYIPSTLTSVTLTASIRSSTIGQTLFYRYGGSVNVIFNNSVTSIGKSAFSGCSGLTSVTIPFVGATKDGTENTHFGYIFGAGTYSDNSSKVPSTLKTVKITGGTSIGDDAFYGCSSLTSVTIPDSVTSIGEFAFSGCSGLTSVTIGNGVTIIGSYAFSGCSGLTSITIPNSVTSIGYDAFYNCSSLTSITIPNSVTSIGYDAFSGCTGLKYNEYDNAYYLGNENNPYFALIKAKSNDITSCDIHSNTKVIYYYAFSDCNSLTSITIPNSVTSIGEHAFSGCSGLTSVTIGNGVTSIGQSAFYGCTGLTSITIPNSVTSIGYSTFSGCSGLTSVTIGNGVTIIGSYAFSGCSGLTSITIPNSVTSIGYDAFYNCSSLTSITIPNSVTSIGYDAFSGCTGLKYNEYDNAYYLGNENNPYFALIKAKSNDITSCDIHSNTKVIYYYAFSDCNSLTSITIPNSVTSIGEHAFSGCSGLTSVTIGNGVTSIGSYAFYGCSGLTSITFKGTKAQWNKITLSYYWKYNSGITKIVCTDGTIPLN